jgi:hypothetical protein
VREQHAQRNGCAIAVLPFREYFPQRLVERERVGCNELQGEGCDEELGQRCEIEARIAKDGLSQGVVARHAVRPFEDQFPAMLDARDGRGELDTAGRLEYCFDCAHLRPRSE